MKDKNYCKHCGRELDKRYKHDLCQKHWDEYCQYGFFISDTQRTMYDPNEIEIMEDYAIIYLYDEILQEKLEDVVLIDLDDVKLIKNIRWNKKHNCIVGNIKGKTILLSNYLLDTNEKIEYINNNYLDNRRKNLNIIKKRNKKAKFPYIINKKNKNKVIVEFIGESHNGVVGSSILCSYPTKDGEYERVLIECGMVQKNGALREEYLINKEVVDRVLGYGELKGVFISHAHLSTTQDYYQQL